MLVRNCSGGIVFYDDKVFIIKNEKEEWTLPKGVIKTNEPSSEIAVRRVKEETGIDVEIISNAGRTSYEFFSITRQKPVCNKVTWYVMKAASDNFILEDSPKITEGGFFTIEDAMEKITYSQDKAIVHLSYEKYKQSE
jgi:ADP-ribose pyrophosphatase YjhB (NUDIX family)